MTTRRCHACGTAFPLRPQAPKQAYCSAAPCQKERRRLWQRERRREDADYRDNQARAHQTWAERNRDYWKRYRQAHPEYTEKNRQQQRERKRTERAQLPTPQRGRSFANMDSCPPSKSPAKEALPAGLYRICPLGSEFANGDSWIVRLTPVDPPPRERLDCKESTP